MIALFVLALVLFGGDWFISTTPDEMTFSYQRIGTGDEYDQVLTIRTTASAAVAPKLTITPLDTANQPIIGREGDERVRQHARRRRSSRRSSPSTTS